METLTVKNQIILLEAIRRFYPQSENKELILPMINQWYNEHANQFLSAGEFRLIIESLYKIPSPVDTERTTFRFC